MVNPMSPLHLLRQFRAALRCARKRPAAEFRPVNDNPACPECNAALGLLDAGLGCDACGYREP